MKIEGWKPNKEDKLLAAKIDEMFCESCGVEMKLNVIKKKLTRWSKGHAMYECTCGHKVRKRTRNEILRDIGERD